MGNLIKLDKENMEDILNLTLMQQGLLFHNIKNDDNNLYFEQLSLGISQGLDLSIFKEAWNLVVEANEMLRTVFRWESVDKPIQIVLRNHKPDIRYIDYSNKDRNVALSLVEDLKIKDREEKFDLVNVPFRITLCKVEEQKYEMIISNHHIIYDGWSNGVVIKEFLNNYNTLIEGKVCEKLKKNKIKNFIKWTQKQDGIKCEEYWRKYLKSFSEKTEINIKKKKKNEVQFCEDYIFRIKKDIVDNFTRQNKITLAALIYTAWGILLQKYNDNEDVVFGTTVSGRTAKIDDIENMVGLFINTIPLRVKAKGNDKIINLLYKVKRELELREEYELTPLVNIKKYSEIDNKDELFDSIVVIENYPLDNIVMKKEGKLSFDSYSMSEINSFDLTLGVTLFEDIEICFTYNKDVFTDEDIKILARHLNCIMMDIIDNPNNDIQDIDILSKLEKEKILYEFNDLEVEYEKDKTISCLFEEQVERTPNNIALICGDKQLTYKELNERANQLATLLIKVGIKIEDVVAIMADRSIEMIVSIIATLKAGGAYLPIDPKYPDARKKYLLENGNVEILLTQKHLFDEGTYGEEDYPVKNIIFPDDENNFTKECENFHVGIKPENLAYVIYTSGTTGKPKGVMVEHKNLVAYMQSYFKIYNINSNDATIQLVPFSFDLFGEELFLALLKGGKFVIPKEDEFNDINNLYELIVKNNITIISCSPLLLNEFNNLPPIKSVRTFINGGDVLKQEYIGNLLSYARVFNGYGPAEATIGASHFQVIPGSDEKSISIGKPMKNYKIYILDKNKRLLPIGVPGEMYIGGEGVARGYLNNKELTNDKFMEDPFFSGGKMYKTGDLVKWRSDGNIEFIGRVDEQVKIRGFRIELGEIENHLQNHKDVKEAVVIAKETKQGNKYLCGYIISDREVDKNELKEFLAKELPDYMIPSYFIRLSKIPTTDNGKIDKRALPEPEIIAESKYAPPTNEIENTMVQVWSEVLKIDKNSIGIDDNFFELGGDSILSMQVVSKAMRKGIKITVNQMFQYQTISQLAKGALKVEQYNSAKITEQVTGDVLLTPIEKWFFEENFKEFNHWNQSVLLETKRNFDYKILYESIKVLIKYHDAFRLRFEQKENQWIQYYGDISEDVACEFVDLSECYEKEKINKMEDVIKKLQGTMNICNGPLYRVAYFYLGEGQKGQLFITIHHLAVDGYSWRVLLEDLQSIYEQLEKGKQVKLAEKTISFKQWSDQINKIADSSLIKDELGYWLNNIPDEVTPIFVDNPEGINDEKSSRIISYSLPKEETNMLIHNIGNAYKTKINDLLLSALSITFSKWTDKLIVDMEGHGREEKFGELDISRTVGWFTSVYPVVLECNVKDKTLEAVIKENKENLRCIPNNGSGYGLLYYITSENNEINLLKAKSKAQVAFNYLGQFDNMLAKDSMFELSKNKVGYTHNLEAMRSHIIEIDCMIVNGRLVIDWKYSTNIHKDESIDLIAKNFINNLKEVIYHCASIEKTRFTPSDFPLIKINQEQVDMLSNKYKNIEDMYSLSPVQQSMIFHHVYSPDSSVTIEQTAFTINSELDINAFEKVWQTIVNKHSSLRASFYWDDMDEPIQIIHKDVKVPFEVIDWQMVDKVELEHKLEEFLEEDRKIGYDLGTAPLMRIYVIKLDANKYYVIWSHHHLQLDGWCLNILLKEIGSFYEAYSSGKKVEITNGPEFKEYLRWLKNQDVSKSEQFWREQLKGFKSPVLLSKELECQINDEHKESKSYGNVMYYMDMAKHEKVLNAAKNYKITLNTIVQGAWAILLSRYTGQRDIVFGTTSSGRPVEIPGVDSMVGCFMNTIPMRIFVDDNDKVDAWLKKIQLTHVNIRQFDYTPLALIRNCSEVPRDSALYDLYESIVIFENYPFDLALKEGLGNLKGGYVKVEEQMDYPITLYCNLQPELSFNLLYDKKYFSEDMVQQILNHLINIINEIICKQDSIVEDIKVLNNKEIQYLLHDINDTDMDYPKNLCYHDMFENYVKINPNHLAIIQGNKQITYRELDLYVNKLANRLVRMGVGPDVLVGVCIERSIEMIIGMLAVVKAGGAFIAIDSEYPKERINMMLEEAQAFLLITQSNLLEEKSTSNEKIIYIDREWSEIEKENDSKPNVNVTPDNLVYVIFTSGSSGKPKGVLMNHEAVVSHTVDMQRCYELETHDRVLQFSSISFDISLEQVFSTLGNGSTLVLRDKEVWTPREFAHKCKEVGLTVTNFPTAYWHQVVQEWANDIEIIPHEKLRLVIVGGEQLLPERVALWEKYPMNKIKLLNAYGPAETAMTSTLYDISQLRGKNRKYTPVGKPLANRRIYVLDEKMNLVPIGAKGELYIGGVPIARGYLNRPELTKEKFIKDPYYNGTGDRLYKTGDVGRILLDGNIEVVGRKDDQIKIRSHRIEIGEIETVISEIKQINNLSVVAKGNAGEHYLVVYYTVKDNFTLTQEQIKYYLSKRMPNYMIPSYFIELEEMPLTPNGKIDKKALPDFNNVLVVENFEAPRDKIETKLADIWQNILGINNISINSNFFELGGHSLRAIMLISKIRQELKVEVPLVKIFELSTIKELGEYIKNAIKYDYEPIVPVGEKEFYEVSAAQKRLFILNQITNNDTNYNMPYALILNGEVNKKKLEDVLNKLVERHESLRTSFCNIDGHIVQKIDNTVKFKIDYLEKSLEHNIDEQIKNSIRPFDLSKAPLFRVALKELKENEHLLIFDMHHIITDGVSMGIFIKEFTDLYEGITLPELNVQYKDFAIWQNNLLQSDKLKDQEEYWLNVFKGDIPVLNMPTDYPRGKEQILIGEDVKINLSKELSYNLKQLAMKNNTTLYSVLVASLNILLHKYSGQNDIVIGTPVAGRCHADTEGLMGMFVNTVAIRNYPYQVKSFKDFLNEVNMNSLNAFENQDYQFENLVDKLQIPRDLSRNPLFDVMFVWQNMDMPDININGLNIHCYEYKNDKVKFDLELKAFEENEEIKLILEYCTQLFRKETIEKMTNHYINILAQLIKDETIKIADIDILSGDEKKQLIEEFNDTKIEYPKNKSLKDLFEEQVERTPDNIAVVFEDKQLSFIELNDRANQLARFLEKEGVERNHIVAIRVEPSLETIISILAVLKVGAAYLPIDYEFPKERVNFIFEDSKCKLLLTKAYLNEELNFDGKVINIEDDILYKGDSSNLKIEVGCNDLAYVIYTSGTTGLPKGVLIENHSVVNYVSWFKRKAKMSSSDKTILTSSFAFDLGYTGLYSALLTGCEMHIMAKDFYLSTYELIEYINKNNITYMKTTPSMFNLLVNSISDRSQNINECSLRLLVLGGEEINLEDVEKFNKMFPLTEFINHYGPTETTIGSIAYKIDFEKFNEYKLNPLIGYPIDNTKVFILNSSLKPVPIGVIGEIYITGEGLAKGYLNRTELDADKFIDTPFELNDYTRMYKTGDLGRYNWEGAIEFVGRKDNQIKIRGYRVELGEIENQILQHESVNDVAVICKKDNDNTSSLCAYMVYENKINLHEIRRFLLNRLPEYMVPSYFMQLNKIPLNENGKIDIKSLPNPVGEVINESEYVAPVSEIEKKLTEIWIEILETKTIGINYNFFEIGGHSLKATVLVSKIYKTFNVEMPLREIFKNPTIDGIAKFIEKSTKSEYEAIRPVDKRDYYSVSAAQRRLYTLFEIDKTGTEYNMPICMEVKGKLDVRKIQEVVNKLVERHEGLRTHFTIRDEEIVQIVNDDIEVNIEIFDYEDMNLIMNKLIKPFDLNKAPLYRVGLVSKGEDNHILIFDMHHIIFDGVSRGILVEEFTKLYEDIKLNPIPIQYKDYSEWQKKLFLSDKFKKQEEYWLDIFKGELPILNMPYDYVRPLTQSFEGDNFDFKLNKDITEKLTNICKETGNTLFMVLLSAYNILLSKYSGQEDIIVGSPIAGRHHADLQNTIGMFVGTLALRNYPKANKTFLTFLNEVRENTIKSIENQDYQFDQLVDKLNVRRDLSRNPLFDTMFVLQNMEMNDIEIEGLTFKQMQFENKISKFDLTLTAEEIEGEITFNLEYCTKLFKKETVDRLATHYINIIENIVLNIDVKIAEIQMLSQQELNQITNDFNSKTLEYPENKTIHELFEEQVQLTPNNIALKYKNQQLTYKELNARTNILASVLRDKGVGRNHIVGIMVERSIEMVVGIMAILKSGAAYLPIDPNYPTERIKYMIDDCNIRILLTQQKLADKVNYHGEILHLDNFNEMSNEVTNIKNVNIASDLAYIIYTSGTTGAPKGILTEHRNVITYTVTFIELYKLNHSDITLQQASFTFDGFVEEIYAMLLVGGKIVIPENEIIKDSIKLRDIIVENGVTILSCSPFMLSEFDKLKPMNSVHTFLSSGDVLKKDFCSNILKYSKVYNMYGPSETTVCATWYQCSDNDNKIVCIGKPIPNYKVYILDKILSVVPVGILGEIYIAGDGVARGYLNRNELTAEKFVLNKFNEKERMYKTGDIARWNKGGNIEFMGRGDNQVKIRGYRIELDEIESELLGVNYIKQVVVIDKKDDDGDKYLCAYIVSDHEINIRDLRKQLLQRLPDYMLPTYFIQIEVLPININGKLNKEMLPEPKDAIKIQSIYEGPKSYVQEELVKIWQDILTISPIGINDNFFDLGGHSLKAMTMTTRIRKELNVEITIKEIFQLQTIKELSTIILTREECAASIINPVRNMEYYPVSAAQKRIYALQKYEPFSTAYNMLGVMLIDGKLDVDRMNQAFKHLINRHEVLRTSFVIANNNIVQKIHDEVDFNLEYDIASKTIEEEMVKFVKPFDLSKTPLLRVKVLKENEEKHILIFDVHHIISDGVSMEILSKEFMDIYQGKELEELRIQYKDYAVWQNQIFNSELINHQEEYWMDVFSKSALELSLPYDFERTTSQSFEGDILEFNLNEEITEKLRFIAKENCSTMYMVLLGIYNILLYKYSGQEDIVVGTPTAGRSQEDLQNVIGMFVNTLAMRNYPNAYKTFKEFLKEIKNNSIKAFQNQDYQFDQLVHKLNIPTELNKNPIFSTMFALQNMDMAQIDFDDIKITQYNFSNKIAKFDITLTAVEMDNVINMNLEYCTKLFKDDTMKSFINNFIKVTEMVVKDENIKIGDIQLVSEYEGEAIISQIKNLQEEIIIDIDF